MIYETKFYFYVFLWSTEHVVVGTILHLHVGQLFWGAQNNVQSLLYIELHWLCSVLQHIRNCITVWMLFWGEILYRFYTVSISNILNSLFTTTQYPSLPFGFTCSFRNWVTLTGEHFRTCSITKIYHPYTFTF